jgi:hypothetical protein
MQRVRVGGSHYVGPRGVDLGVNREGSSIDGSLPFHYLAVVVYENQVGGANLTEVHAEGVDPEVIKVFRITSRDVTAPLVESESRTTGRQPTAVCDAGAPPPKWRTLVVRAS